ncbi:MerR family transcriptional regulator [Mycolicibacterium goodii]|uniref:MerR family transcriptional regulator n=1 Tax=Mycolicibacterium goodii TaxID=134601 RepID=UPI0009FB35F5
MRIGELARRTGVSERSLRYYEQQGLLVSERTPSGHRQYSEAAVDRVVHIQELYAAGLNSRTIASLLPCMRDTDGGPSPQATPQLLTVLASERERLDKAMRELAAARDVLDEVIVSASEPATGTAQNTTMPRRLDGDVRRRHR